MIIMRFEITHLSDEELLLSADGELPAKQASAVHVHLETCWECRTRFAEMQNAIGDFIHIYRERSQVSIPPIDGPRALLRAEIRQFSSASTAHAGRGFVASTTGGAREWAVSRVVEKALRVPHVVAFATVLATFALLLFVVHLHRAQLSHHASKGSSELNGAMPQVSLTPGETVSVTVQDVCAPDFPTERQMLVPASLRRRVFQQYGISNPRPDAFEVDYLITPDLGGASSARNLWPEPYHNTIWNARVKDELEVHLKDLVCSGKLDMATAQRDLSGNWIASYKKYFQTDAPLGKPRPFLALLARFNHRELVGAFLAP